MIRTRLLPYKRGSKGARRLAQGLGIKRLKSEGSRFYPRLSDIIINWGSTTLPRWVNIPNVLNRPECVAIAANKAEAFQVLHAVGVTVPEFTFSPHVADDWVRKEAVLARHKLTGKGGDGIEYLEPQMGQVPKAPLYVKYIKTTSEWRVHATRDEAFFTQRKVRNKAVPDDEVDWVARNHGNGFIYQVHGNEPPACVNEAGLAAVRALGLDFGAVDIIYNQHYDKAYVLEVNTAPGLEGDTTLGHYITAIRKLIKFYQ